MATASLLTADRVRELFHYDPLTGVFTRLRRTSNNVKHGEVAGSLNGKGYLQIRVDGRVYYAHRLAWLYFHGVWPTDQIDHRNNVKHDNRICNLRESTNSQNQQNRQRARSDNKSGFLGARWYAPLDKWRASIGINGKNIHLGYFPTAELANAAYVTAKRERHPMGTL